MIAGTSKTAGQRFVALALFIWQTSDVVSSQGMCTFSGENGSIVTFQAGESIHSFKPSRCLSNESFPCICNAGAPGQIECPYCWLPSDSGDLLCANDGDSVTYSNVRGELETCDCSVSSTEFNSFTTDCRPAVAEARQGTTPGNGFGDGVDTGFFFNGNTCNINGVTYDRGQALGFSYDSGCSGPSFDYQCFCNPDKPDQVECPYCYFDVQGRSEPICLRDGEVATFDDVSGNSRTCGCTVPDGGTARPNCFFAPENANTCAIQVADGSVQTFAAGESLHRDIPSRCGSDFPCYCEPTIAGQIWCPYCSFPQSQNSLLCAQDGQTVTFLDMSQQMQTCSCQVPFDPSQPPVSSCLGAPSEEVPNTGDLEDRDDSDSPNTGGLPNSFRVCELNGNIFFEGENVGENFVTRCGDPDDFPCFCNPDNDPPVDCPYCGFALTKENLLCLKNEQIANFVDIRGDSKTCECRAPTVSATPTENCLLPSSEANICFFRDADGHPVTFDAGEPVDNALLPVSQCGPNYQCFCDPKASNQLSCPFCVEVDFGGTLICASAGEIVAYQDSNGFSQRCFCDVPSDLSERDPMINCVDQPPIGPTDPPAIAPSPIVGPSCSVLSPLGQVVTAADGEAFGPELGDGVCGSISEWPKLCNAAGRTQEEQISYPYCTFGENAFGRTQCAVDNGSVRFVASSSSPETVECTCRLGDASGTGCTGGNSPNEGDSARSTRIGFALFTAICSVFVHIAM